MNCISYTNNNVGFCFAIPIHLQRLMIKEYCQSLNLSVSFEHNELDSLFHLPILVNILENTVDTEIVFFSIHSMPQKTKEVERIFEIFRNNNIKAHFANEGLCIEGQKDERVILELLSFNTSSHDEQSF